MAMTNYQYSTPEETITIEEFIACQSDEDFSYYNLSFVDKVDYSYMNETILYSTYNVVRDYLDELREQCLTINLSDDELTKYIYRPKLLAHDIYGTEELYFMILLINDMWSVKQFTKNKLLLPTKANMQELCKELYNANHEAIQKYNDATLYNAS